MPAAWPALKLESIEYCLRVCPIRKLFKFEDDVMMALHLQCFSVLIYVYAHKKLGRWIWTLVYGFWTFYGFGMTQGY